MYGMRFGNLTVWGCLEAQSQCSPHKLFIRLCPWSCTASDCKCPILPVFSVANHKGLHGLLGSLRRAPVPADGTCELASILDCHFYSHHSRNQKKDQTNVTFHHDYCRHYQDFCFLVGFFAIFAFWHLREAILSCHKTSKLQRTVSDDPNSVLTLVKLIFMDWKWYCLSFSFGDYWYNYSLSKYLCHWREGCVFTSLGVL